LLACALLVGPLLGSAACGDDKSGDDDDDEPTRDASADAGDSSTRPPEAGIPDGGRVDGGTDMDSGPRMDGSAEASTPVAEASTADATLPDGNTPPPPPDGSLVDSSSPPPDGAVPGTGDTWGFTSAKRLVLFARATGVVERTQAVTGIPEAETVLGVDVRPADSTVVALTNAGKLYTVNAQTGVAVLKSTLAADAADGSNAFTALAGSAYAVDFNPVADRLRIVSNTGQNLRVNADTGATITDANVTPDTPGLSAAAYTNSFGSACRTQLFVIDSTARTLLLQDPPNQGVLTQVGSLGEAAIGQVHSFEIVTNTDGTNIALVSATTSSGERVSQLNLSTGALSAPQSIALNTGERLDAIFALPPTAAVTQPLGELLAVTAGNKVVSFNRAAPSKLCTSVAISGLGGGEQVLGADVRPADGQLYALTSLNKLYTVALATGAATAKSTLTADAADASDAFTALSGSDFGIGFNPVADRLRVLGGGQNLRVNVDTGATTTDVALNPGTPAIAAAAYTNSFAGAATTTLYAIDSASNDLVRIGGNPGTSGTCPEATNPNCGTTTSLGDLNATADVTAIGGFDIDATSSSALAALTLGDATSSTLYSINLSTGAATVPTGVTNGTIGGGERIRSLSFAANPTATAYAVSGTNRLLGFAPRTPGTLTRNVEISGLQGGENIVGIDVRPVDGKLYAMGSAGRLYTVDTTTGAATFVAATTNPNGSAFTLPASTYGVDFSPSADQLRFVNIAEQNFRVIPAARTGSDAGDVLADSAIDLDAANDVSGAAYTNNFAGTANSTLFITSATTLYRLGGVDGTPPPNTGLTTSIGALGVTANGDVGFDIVGGHNGLVLAAISTNGTSTALYSVNLTTGAATAYNAASNDIAMTGDAPLRGFAIDLR
jgi:hypothetical protein